MPKVFYRDENVMLIQGDCLEVMPKLKRKFDAVITDPPYGTTACKWDTVIPFDSMWECLNGLIKDKGAICLFGGEPFSSTLRLSNISMYKYDWYWNKNSTSGFVNAKNKPMNTIETISVFSNGTCANGSDNKMIYLPQGLEEYNKFTKRGNKEGKENTYWRPSTQGNVNFQKWTNYPRNYLQFSKPPKAVHPTQKPEELLEYLIKTYTNEGETVLDFTAGSGTTLIAALQAGRRVVGIEMDEKYCEITVNRIREYYKQLEN